MRHSAAVFCTSTVRNWGRTRRTCGFPGHCHEYQRVCTWAIDKGVPFVFVAEGEKYDAEKWGAVHHGRREPAPKGCGCVVM